MDIFQMENIQELILVVFSPRAKSVARGPEFLLLFYRIVLDISLSLFFVGFLSLRGNQWRPNLIIIVKVYQARYQKYTSVVL